MSRPTVTLDEIPANMSVEQVVDEDIRSFDEAFQRLGNEPMTPSEKAIVKTYLAYKLGITKGAIAPPAEPKAPQGDATT